MKKILMVDDEPDILKIVKYRLINEGFAVVLASNGKEGIEKARMEHPDLIIMDFRMPGLDGIAAAMLIKEDPLLKHIPILIMSASSAMLNEEKIKKLGIEGLLSKPFEAAQLLQKVKDFLL